MNDAYEIVPVLERLPLEIESLAAYDGNLVVGTRQGHLLMYSVGESGAQADVKLLRSNKNFSKKPIIQVAVVPHYQILISLSDNIISIHDLTVYNFPLLSIMNNTKGATVFDLEIKQHVSLTGETPVTVRLAVAVRRRVQLYYWKARQFQTLQDDIVLTETPQQMLWCGGALVLDQGLTYQRILLDKPAGQEPQEKLAECSRGTDARVVRTSRDAVALQVASCSVQIMEKDGSVGPVLKLAFSAQPSVIAYQMPLALGVVANKTIEVVSVEDSTLLQTLPLHKPKLLVPDVASVGVVRSSARCRSFCASPSHVWCLTGLSPGAQIPNLLSSHHYNLALKILDLWGGRTSEEAAAATRVHIHKLHAFHLFCSHQYQRALDIFLDIDTELLFVIGLFPALVPEDCQRRLQYPNDLPSLTEPQLRTALACLIDYLLKKRQRLVMELDKKGSRDNTPKKSASSKTRGTLQYLLQVVDTTLLKCYLEERPSLVGPLLRIPDGRVSLAEGERLLREHNRLPDFLQLLRARGQHSKALALLHQHQHTTHPSPLKGPWVLVEYLQNLGVEHTEVILANSAWLVKHHPLEALRVFTGAGAPVTDAEQLSRETVAEFIKPLQPRLCLLYLEHVVQEWKEKGHALHNKLVKLYRDIIIEEAARQAHLQRARPDHELTGYIFDMSITSPDDAPKDAVKETSATNVCDTDHDLLNQDTDTDLNETRETTHDTSDVASFTPLEEIHLDLRFSLDDLQERLLKFLHSSTYYSPTTALLSLPPEHTCLLAGRAVVLGRLDQHRQALQLYISQLHDLPSALAYCNEHYASSGPASQVYLFLLELLIQCDDVAALLSARPAHGPSNSAVSPSKPSEISTSQPKPETGYKNERQLSTNDNSRNSNDSSSSNNMSSFSNSINDSNYHSGSSSKNVNGTQRSKSPSGTALRNSSASPPHHRPDASDNTGVDDRGRKSTGARSKPGSPLTTIVDSRELPDSGRSSCHSLESSSSSSSTKPPALAGDPDAKFDILLNLLHTYSQNIRLKPAVQLLPDSLKVQELRNFLQSWVRQFASARHKMELQHGAAQAVLRQVTSDLCLVQSNKITLSSQNTCCICKKRLTRFSAFVCSPSGAVCHFSCRERVHSSWMQEVQEARQQQELKARTNAAVAAAVGSSSVASSPPGGQ